MMELLTNPQTWIAFATLTLLELVLGIDNIIFISILVGRLPPHLRDKARRLGLGFAMLSRLALLFTLSWVMAREARREASRSRAVLRRSRAAGAVPPGRSSSKDPGCPRRRDAHTSP